MDSFGNFHTETPTEKLNCSALKMYQQQKFAIFSTKVGKLAWIFWRFAFVCNRKRNGRRGKQDKNHLNA
jgi:hypothetical protein